MLLTGLPLRISRDLSPTKHLKHEEMNDTFSLPETTLNKRLQTQNHVQADLPKPTAQDAAMLTKYQTALQQVRLDQSIAEKKIAHKSLTILIFILLAPRNHHLIEIFTKRFKKRFIKLPRH